MKSIRTIGAAAVAFGLCLTAMAQDAEPVEQPASGDPITNTAAVYATYQSDVTDVKTEPLGSASDIDEALNSLGGHNPDQLSAGWIAYSSLIASQDPEYRAAVKDIESYYGSEALIKGMSMDASYARTLNGGDNAVSAALGATEADSKRLSAAAAFVKEQAYSLQSKAWAKRKIGNSGAKATRLNSQQTIGTPAKSHLLAAFSAADIDSVFKQAGSNGAPSLWDNVSDVAGAVRFPAIVSASFTSPRKRVKFGKEPIADRIATLAAYRVLGTDDMPLSQITSAMSERNTRGCLNMANLNLQQCVAAANQQYEVPFCIGEHALAEVGECIGGVYQ